MDVVGQNNIRAIDFTILSKSRTGDTLPLHTKCWAKDNKAQIAASDSTLIIYAQVVQGNKPVMFANVFAQLDENGIKSANTKIVHLMDNGNGADNMKNDGIYSRYFNGFEKAGRYILKCQVNGNNDTNINGGFDVALKFASVPATAGLSQMTGSGSVILNRFKRAPESPRKPRCCGSNTIRDDTIFEPTGEFARLAFGGALNVTL